MINLRDFKNAQARRNFLERKLKISLKESSKFSFTEEQVKNRNIENLIGATQIPLGMAGPIKINGQYAKGEFYLPLGTSEGALVASVSRGCKAITQSGGVAVLVENVGVTRGPVFKTKHINEAKKLSTWLNHHYNYLNNCSKKTSSHLELLKIDTQIVGNLVFARFYFDTKDAMGMNMVTKATDLTAQLIETKTDAKCVSLAGNFDIDKKPSWLNFLKGRGKKVWAEAIIKKEIVQKVLKTTTEKICEVAYTKCLLGSIMAGSLGFNAHLGNIVASLFCATGQDLAHITEGSLGITTTEIVDADLYISCYLPDLMIGTIGGGTGLPTQKEALSILGIPDPKLKEGEQVLKLAEIMAGAVLAGELSLLGALAAGDLAKAHERWGRGKK